jgi:invasion protein IalB
MYDTLKEAGGSKMRKLFFAVLVMAALLMVGVSYEARAQTPEQAALQQELVRLQAAVGAFNSRCTGAHSRSDAALYQECAAEKSRLVTWQSDLQRRASAAGLDFH